MEACHRHARGGVRWLGKRALLEQKKSLDESFKSTGGRCSYCKTSLEFGVTTTKDHYVPVVLGGGDGENIVVSCRPCNIAKGNMDPRGLSLEEVCQRVAARKRRKEYEDRFKFRSLFSNQDDTRK
jgi:5-methylcytosine-specific restriction endonuclease McrA